jgi:hypothetical protein
VVVQVVVVQVLTVDRVVVAQVMKVGLHSLAVLEIHPLLPPLRVTTVE